MARVLLSLVLLFVPRVAAAQSPVDRGDVVINEIMYAPSPASNEFIEIHNRSSEAVALRHLEYADANRSFSPITSADTLLAPGGYAVLARDSAAFVTAFPAASAFTPPGWDALNNGGDTVFLRHAPSGTVVDSVPYDPDWGGSDGASLERIDPAGPSTRALNFNTTEAPGGGTPGDENSIYNPDETPPTLVSVQPRPAGDSLLARFSEPVDRTTVSKNAFHLEGPTSVVVRTTTVTDTAAAVVLCVLDRRLSTGTYRFVASGVADRRGNVQSRTTASTTYFVPSVPAPRDVVITEIQYAPSPVSTEFIEIYNRSDDILDLGQIAYADENEAFTRIAPRLTPLRPDSHAVIVRDAATFERAFPSISHHAPGGWDALNNGGDTVHLQYAPTNTILDSIPYSPDWGGDGDPSLERIDPAGPSTHPSNFGTSTARRGATPGTRNSLYDPDEQPPSPVFAEQTDSTNLRIVFSEALRPETVTPRAFDAPSASVTAARLRGDSVVVLTLKTAPSGSTLEVSGVEDRVGNATQGAAVSVAYRPPPGQLVVNEIMFDPRTDDFDDRPNQVEYVELRNRSSRPLSLNGLFVTDRPDERGVADTIRAGRRAAVAPGGLAVVAAAPHGREQVAHSMLAAAFRTAPLVADSVTYLPVETTRLGLGNDGDRVRMHRADGLVLSDVQYSPDWHTPGLEDPTGTSLERISVSAGATAPDNWTSSTAPRGGTPGAANDVSLPPPAEAPNRGLSVEPSPFSIERDGATRIRYTLTEVPNLIRVRIFDARGRKVRTLENARLAGRSGELVWNGRNDRGERVRIGVYVVLFEAMQAESGTIAQFKTPVTVARPLD